MNEPLPTPFNESFKNLYGSFGHRFAALLLDGLFLTPLIVISAILNSVNLTNFYITLPLTNLISLFYYIYLPVKYGATPGKLLMNMQILKIDGTAINYKDAFLRNLPSLVLALTALVTNVIAVTRADADFYNSAKFMEQSNYISSLNPKMFYSQLGLTYIFLFTSLILFLTNSRKRSISDFSGNTVVVYKHQLKKIEDFKKKQI
ncbi:RDD family protein [Flavobacterium sp. SUN052]|uniref:RDD family protein n=1 Tax=Flavobacterium sp. SUN052 TaxID=3002441 RepID=UPI00237E4295|nr:RDD family protein [Flavobacterium sp. SUN052]MEC4003644.1 RDD family protein [Flavobacterium sp. SUN052]